MKTDRKSPKELVDKLPTDWPFIILGQIIHQNADAFSEAEVLELNRVLRARDVKALFSALESCSPQSMVTEDDPRRFRVRYLVASLFKKFPFRVPGVNKNTRRNAAIEKFLEAEKSCRWFNTIGYKNALAANERDPELWGFLDIMRRVIGRILGEFEEADLTSNCRFGPGASLTTDGNKVTSFYKYDKLPYDVSGSALPAAHDLVVGDDRWFTALASRLLPSSRVAKPQARFLRAVRGEQHLKLPIPWKLCEQNRVSTVPKTWSVDRTIAVEPLMNVSLQLGVDGWIRSRLKRWGVNLDDQTKNQLLAARGSEMELRLRENPDLPLDPFCTLDLKGASETVSLWLLNLLPENWARYLDNLRSRHGLVKHMGSNLSITYEKVSSMGNGFTFALESLIFFAAVYAARELEAIRKNCHSRDVADLHTEIAVYGDDIVVPRSMYHRVEKILVLLGFTVNRDKSFCVGGFRESCGCDYLFGAPVRPVFFNEDITDAKTLFSAHNRLIAWDANHYYQVYGSIPDNFDGHFLRDSLLFLRRYLRAGALRLVGPPNKEVVDSNLQVNPFIGLRYARWCDKLWAWRYPSILSQAVIFEARPKTYRISGRKGPFDGSDRFLVWRAKAKDRNTGHYRMLSLLNRLAILPELPNPFDKNPATGCCFDVTRRDSVVHTINYETSTTTWSADQWLADKQVTAR